MTDQETSSFDLNTYLDRARVYADPAFAFYRRYRSLILIIVIPIFCSIVPIIWPNPIGLCAFVLLLMSVYWVVLCIPIAVTSLLPVMLFPLLGVMPSDKVSAVFFNDNIMFILGSLMIGIGVETTNLHRKLALRVVILVGTHPRWLLLGIMLVSWFLSVWISNTATTAMMLPIVLSLVKNLVKLDTAFHESQPEPRHVNIYISNSSSVSLASVTALVKNDEIEKPKTSEVNEEEEDEKLYRSPKALNAIKCFLLCIPYSTLIGGSASLIGTNSNLVFKGYFEENHPDDGMNFFTFMLYAMPCSIVNLLCAWLVLGTIYLPKEKFINFRALFKKSKYEEDETSDVEKNDKKHDPLKDLVQNKYDELGPYTWEQLSVGTWFVTVIILLVTRDLYFVDGWGALFSKGFVTDTTVAITVLIILIVWPKTNIFKTGDDYAPLIEWKDIERLFPWGVLILLGGSLAIAKGCEVSGLSAWLGKVFENILPNNKYLDMIIMVAVSSVGTEFMSNVSMITIILPILDSIAKDKQISYFFMLLPQSIAVNLSYMFPSAAAPNAIVFGPGYIKLQDMMLIGFIMKIIGIVLTFIVSTVWLPVIFPDTYMTITTEAVNTTMLFNTTDAAEFINGLSNLI